MKILSKLFGGLFGGNIKFFTIAAIVGGLLFVGWHYPHSIGLAKDRKDAIKDLNDQIKTKDNTIKMLEGRIREDSTLYLKNVEIFQKNIIELNNRNSRAIKEVDLAQKELIDCENGLDCWEKPLLGKWRKVKCRDNERD